MDKINIENLFANGENDFYISGSLDVFTLFSKEEKNKEYNFNSNVLLDCVRKRRQKMKEYCDNAYKLCCERIESANKSGLTDIIFEIAECVPDCLNYKPRECLEYIEKKLKAQKISTYTMSDTQIFITWINLEDKLDDTVRNII